MSNTYAVPALTRLRAEIAGRIEHHQTEAEKAAREIAHVDAVLHMIAPELALEAIRTKAYPPRTQPRRNAGGRLVATIMRERGVPLLVAEITDEIVARRKLELDERAYAALKHQVENAMTRLRRQGGARNIPQDVGPQRWSLVD